MKIGDKVKFVPEDKHIPKYYHEVNSNIPRSMIKDNGIALVGEHYKKHFAKIVNTYNEFFIVEFVDDEYNTLRLGFKKESLKLLTISNWRKEMEG